MMYAKTVSIIFNCDGDTKLVSQQWVQKNTENIYCSKIPRKPEIIARSNKKALGNTDE